MQDFSNQSFIYSGQKYTASFTLYNNSNKYFQTHGLNNEDVAAFDYVNEANGLYIKASMVYVDRYGIIDKYFEKQFTYCSVLFAEIERTVEEDITVEKVHPTNFFNHEFFVTSIEITNRQDKNIAYKLNMVSSNWFKLIATLTFSNYGKRPEPVFDLVKTALQLNNLLIDDKSFDMVKSTVKLNYITNGNDNTLTMVKYLLSKMYYYAQKDDAVKFIFYNDLTHKYQLFDITNQETSNGIYSLVISLFNTQNETYLQEEPMNLGTVTKVSKTAAFKNMFNFGVTDYDYQHNIFVDRSIKSEDIINYRNKRYVDTNYTDKFEYMFDTKLNYTNQGSYWNNDTFSEIYNDTMMEFMKDNALVINCCGVLTRKPGDCINLNVDRKTEYLDSEEHDSLDDLKHRYKSFEGSWIAAKVHHFIYPQVGKYRQNLVVFRNYVTDTINKDAK